MSDDKGKKKGAAGEAGPRQKLDTETYERELGKLQVELVKLQEWIKHEGKRVAVLFEGRDAAGKGGTIKRITENLNPRVVRIAALPTPGEREKTEWYFQRYVAQLPAAGGGAEKLRDRLAEMCRFILSRVRLADCLTTV